VLDDTNGSGHAVLHQALVTLEIVVCLYR
jgi:hypothetical protein